MISSTIKNLSYREAEKTMTAEFQKGSRYEYYDISKEEYNMILQSNSPGSTLKEITKEKKYLKV